MMAIKINWQKLKEAHKYILERGDITDQTDLSFILIFHNGTAHKTIIKFNEFMNFFWKVSDNDHPRILALIVQDKEGRILYRHREFTNGNEEIPIGGHPDIILCWKNLSKQERESYLRLLISQIQAYE